MKFSIYAFLVLLSLSGCKSENNSTTVSPEDYQAPPAREVTFRQSDNTVRVGMTNEPPSLNPVLSSASISRYVHEMIFQTLNGQDPEDFSAVPLLASLPDVQPEANGYVGYAYTIDPDATWPNGLPVTAADVVFSMKIYLSPLIGSGAYRSYYDAIANIITSPNDERRFKVMTDEPYLLSQDAIGSLVVYPEYVYDPEKTLRKIRLQELATDRGAARLAKSSDELIQFSEVFNALAASHDPADLVGSGPYQLAEWDAGQQISLRKHEQYWAEGRDEDWLRAEPEMVTYTFIQDANTIGTALRDELVDVAVGLPVEQFQTLRKEPYLRDRYDFLAVDGLKYYGILFNQQLPIFREVATRRALARIVDVDRLVEQLFPGGLAKRITGPVMESKTYFDEALPPVQYDPQAAKEELAAAGWSDSNGNGTLDREIDGELRELAFEFLIFPSPTSEAIGALVAEWAAAIGVDVTVVAKDGRSLFADLNEGDFAMATIGQSFEPTPDDFTQVWASTSIPPNGTNRGGFSDQRADRLLSKIRTTLDAEAREPLYREFQRIIYDNQPMIFLFSTKDRLVVSRRFQYGTRAKAPNLFFNALRKQAWNQSGDGGG